MRFLSVDGGATKTIAAVYSSDGEILGVGVKGPSNFRNIGIASAQKHIYDAMSEALRNAGASFSQVELFTFALAGVKDSRKSTDTIRKIIDSYGIDEKYELYNDGEAGYNSRLFGKNGIIVAPGTGMIAYGKHNSMMERSGGWGWLIGDEGGAFFIAKRAIQEIAKIDDGRSDVESTLPDSFKSKLKLSNARQLVNYVYHSRINIRNISALAPLVSGEANKGDRLSQAILEEAAAEAGKCAIALYRRLSMDRDTFISGYGGVYRSGSIYWDKLKETIQRQVSQARFLEPLFGYHAVIGSILMVYAKYGIETTDEDRQNLRPLLDSLIIELPEASRKKYLLMS